jgi:hypothetical protein
VHDFFTDARVGLSPIPFPTKIVGYLASEMRTETVGRPAPGRKVRAWKNAIRQVLVVEVAGRLGDVVEDLDRAIQLALADGPRAVVCDLSAVLQDAEPVAIEVLATAGRHVRDWPGIPVAVACPDTHVREALVAHPLGRHLIVTASLFSAVNEVLATPTLAVETLQLAPHPTAPHASRNFVTRTLLDWRLGRVIPFASLVISELVASSTVNAGTDVDVSVVWNLEALRLSVRDHGPGLPRQPHSALDLHGRGLAVVAGLSRAFGVLPAADGGKVVWAVLEAPRPLPSTRRIRSGRTTERQDSPVFKDGLGLAELPFCAGSSRAKPKNPPSQSVKTLRARGEGPG